ncbi:MAG: hypothetical protein NPINA01_18570 [Nitrospinaceae bacterium]|nr:MAG: hypothetical protein NPINA01_18570 [Nitrospinaceae bacterium]
MRKKEAAYAEFKLDNLSLSDDNLMDFRVEHSILQESGISKEASMGLVSN